MLWEDVLCGHLKDEHKSESIRGKAIRGIL